MTPTTRMKWKWPKCRCGGVAVYNASGDISRTCIRCGSIVNPNYPSNDAMGRDLVAGGWTRAGIGRWRAPNGALYLGPFQAWKAMNGILLHEGVWGDHREEIDRG